MFGSGEILMPTIRGGKIRPKEADLAGQEVQGASRYRQATNQDTVQSTKCLLDVDGDFSAKLEGSRGGTESTSPFQTSPAAETRRMRAVAPGDSIVRGRPGGRVNQLLLTVLFNSIVRSFRELLLTVLLVSAVSKVSAAFYRETGDPLVH